MKAVNIVLVDRGSGIDIETLTNHLARIAAQHGVYSVVQFACLPHGKPLAVYPLYIEGVKK